MSTLARYNGLSDRVQSMFESMPSILNDVFDSHVFNIDIKENDSQVTLSAELPGVSKDDIDIDVTNGLLTITATKKSEQSAKGSNYTVQERRYGKLSRSFRLDHKYNTDSINAELKDGVLTVVLNKTDEAKRKRVEIKSA